MPDLAWVARYSIGLLIALCSVSSSAAESDNTAGLIDRGVALRTEGRLDLAIDTLALATGIAATPVDRARAEGELGATLFQAHRYEESETHLKAAYQGLPQAARAPYAIDLGNLAVVRNQPVAARQFFEEGLQSGDAVTRIGAELNLVTLADPKAKLSMLQAASNRIAALPMGREHAFYALNAGDQAMALGAAGLRIAYADIGASEAIADGIGDGRLSVESRDALAELYEKQHRTADALALDRDAEARAALAPPASVADLLIALNWRDARLFEGQRQDDLAIAAYRRAVDQIQAIRQDIPIAYQDGRSSFAVTLEPVYLGLVDLLLRRATRAEGSERQESLRRVKDVLELSKQAEMQDYLGDRCTVDALRGAEIVPAQGTAFIYPIVLPGRLELLLETNTGLSLSTVDVDSKRIDQVARAFADTLRADAGGYHSGAEQLYQWLIAPLDSSLQSAGINTLVVVSDGVLRLVPFGALYDGHQFVIERFGVATVTGLSMTNATAPPLTKPTALVAGLSLPGSVVSKLPQSLAPADTGDTTPHAPGGAVPFTRSLPTVRQRELDQERASLALPGVSEEVQTLTHTLDGKELLNAQFTEANFRAQTSSGRYSIVHIASHGYFGGSANDSFILTYDELLTLSDLQVLLESQEYRAKPIEILSLSACETAEGNARSPLGISGAAMKARAKSVLGTLWPVDDQATRTVMEQFYAGLEATHESKVDALRAAQLQLLHDPKTADPFYWAPFVLIGNWL